MSRGRILVAPAAFKGTLSAPDATRIIAETVREMAPDAEIIRCPIADGGDDTLAVLQISDSGFERREMLVTGPVPGQRVRAGYLVHPQKRLIVIEAAQAHGITRLPEGKPAPFEATSFGVGEMLAAAFQEAGTDSRWTLTLTIGGSASTDGGAGALQAVGYRFFQKSGEITEPLSAKTLAAICRVEAPPCLPKVRLMIASDVTNPLLGRQGAAAVYAPQKGATPEEIPILEAGLAHWAAICRRDLQTNRESAPGAGAAGGLGYGLMQIPGAEIVSGSAWISSLIGLSEKVASADAILTGEGRFDQQSLSGKGTGMIITLAGSSRPVLVLCGQMGPVEVQAENIRIFPFSRAGLSERESLENPESALRKSVIASALNIGAILAGDPGQAFRT